MNLCFVFDDPNALCVVHLLWLLYYLVRKVIALTYMNENPFCLRNDAKEGRFYGRQGIQYSGL